MSLEILIALADETLAEKYTRFFRNSGFRVAQAWNGLDCWDSVQRLRPDAVILDEPLLWGGGDGVVARLREDLSDAGIPVVMLDANRAEPEFSDTRLEAEEAFPIVARFPTSYRLSAVLNALVAGLRDFRPVTSWDRSEQLAVV